VRSCLLGLLLVACKPDPVDVRKPRTNGPDWTDVAPIIDAHCAGCHQQGAIAEPTLASFAEVSAAAPLVRARMLDTEMPPWPAGPGDVEFLDVRSVPEPERELVIEWVDAGAPLGRGDETTTLTGAPPPSLPRVDHELTLAEPYVPEFEGADDYRCFLLEGDQFEGFITGVQVVPGNRTTVHHAGVEEVPAADFDEVLALDAADPRPGFECERMETKRLGGFVPGREVSLLPEGYGIKVHADSRYLLVMHYSALTWDGQPDDTRARLMVQDQALHALQAEVRHKFGPLAVGAGEQGVEQSVTRSLRRLLPTRKDGEILSVVLHMHQYGVSGRVVLVRDDQETVLLDVPRWDFDWQLEYWLAEPIRVSTDDELRVECVFDNPTDVDVYFGADGDDEMCNAVFFFGELD
jgi:hypothetical protein